MGNDVKVPAWATQPVTAPPAWATTQDTPVATTGPEPTVPADEPQVESPAAKGLMQVGSAVVGGALATPGDVAAGPLPTAAGAGLGYAFGTGMYNALQNLKDFFDPKGSKGPPVTLSQDTIDMIKSGTLAAGGAAGQEAGAGLNLGGTLLSKLPFLKAINPAIANRIIGGGAGTFAGSLTGDQAQTVAKLWSGIPADQRTPELLDQVRNAVINGGLDMALGTTVAGAPGLARNALRSVWGLTDDALNLFKTAQKAGIPLNIANVSNNEIARGYLTIVNMVPMLAHPYSEISHIQEGAVNSRFKEITEAVAGGAVPDAATLSRNTVNSADKLFATVTDNFNQQYDKLLAEARVAGPIVPTTVAGEGDIPSIQQVGQNYLKTVKASTLPQMQPTRFGAVVRSGNPAENLSVDQQAINFARRLTNLPKVITVDQADGMLSELDTLFAKAQKSGTKIYDLSQLKQSVQSALGNSTDIGTAGTTSQSGGVDTLGQTQGSIGQRFKALDGAWSDMRSVFESATAQKFNQVQKNAFRIALSKAGGRTEDTVGQLLYNMKSPDQVEELRSLVGDDLIHQGAARFLEEAHTGATKGLGINATFDATQFAKNIGLNDEKGLRWQAVSAALNGTDITPQMLKDYVHASAATQALQIAPTSTMLARRLVLGGALSMVHAIFPVGGALEEGGLGMGVGTLAGVITAYKGAQIFSNPQTLVNMTRAMDSSVPDFDRRMALVRAIKFLFPASQDIGETSKRGIGSQEGASFPSTTGDSSFLQGRGPQVPNTP